METVIETSKMISDEVLKTGDVKMIDKLMTMLDYLKAEIKQIDNDSTKFYMIESLDKNTFLMLATGN
jgi:hypothetical protein